MRHMSHVATANLRDLSWLSMPDRIRYFELYRVFRIKAGTVPGYMYGTEFPTIISGTWASYPRE